MKGCAAKSMAKPSIFLSTLFFIFLNGPLTSYSNLESISVAKHDDYIVVLSKHKFGFRIQKAVS